VGALAYVLRVCGAKMGQTERHSMPLYAL